MGNKSNELVVQKRDVWIQLQRWLPSREFAKRRQGKSTHVAGISGLSVTTQILEVSGF